MVRVLVTGGNGFLGSHLVQELLGRGDEVTATYLREPPPESSTPGAGARFTPLDVSQQPEVARVIREVDPEVVYHFAGLSTVRPSWADPMSHIRTNLEGTIRILEGVRVQAVPAKLVFAGSGTEYGVPAQVPTPEESPLLPTSPYAMSKAAADLACYQYYLSYGLPVIRLRLFGATGYGKRGDALNDFAAQIARREGEPHPTLHVGDLRKRRDILDVKDAIWAILRIVEKGNPGEAYNVGRGEAFEIRSLLDGLLAYSTANFEVVTTEQLLRPVDAPVQCGDIRRLRSLGWAPSIPIEQTLREILTGWRHQVRTAVTTATSSSEAGTTSAP